MKQERFYREDYFIFRGIAYGVGTTVLFNENVTSRMNARHRDKPHEFIQGFTNGWKRFKWQNPNNKIWDISEPSNIIPDRDIKEIVHPVPIEITPIYINSLNNAVLGKVEANIGGGVLLYILTMISGLIFNDWLVIWIFATVIFISWLIKKYRN